MQSSIITKAIADEQSRDRLAIAQATRARREHRAEAAPRREQDIVIRLARSQDAGALRTLAQLDGRDGSFRLWDSEVDGPVLVAESGGTVAAALRVSGGAAVADPFRRSAHLVALLRTRADQITRAAGGRRSARRRLALVRRAHA